MEKLIPIDLTGVIEDVKAEGKSRRVLWQDSESIAFLSSGRKERWDFHIDPADEVTLQLTGVQHLVYRTAEGKEQTADIKAGQILLCPAGVPHSPRLEPDSWFIVFERKRRPGGHILREGQVVLVVLPSCERSSAQESERPAAAAERNHHEGSDPEPAQQLEMLRALRRPLRLFR